MSKLLISIKKRPLNILLIIFVSVLYWLNNYFIKPNTNGVIHGFFVSFFNDLICPFFFLGYVNFLLITVNKEIQILPHLLLISFLAGCVWEFVSPFFKQSSVTDPIDLLCYLIGTVGYWLLLKKSINKGDKISD